MPEYTIVVPIYNDAYLAKDLCQEVQLVFGQALGAEKLEERLEVIFVNDGSRDDSFVTLRDQVCAQFPFAKAIDLSRNFGQHIAISAGYKHASGKYVGYFNADMEDPPAELLKLFEELKKNDWDFVGGRYRSREMSLMNRVTSRAFHWLLNRLTGYAVPLDMSASRVMSRRFIDAYNSLSEKSRYLPGLESWLGFKRTWKQIEHQRRKQGKSSYNFRKRLALALDSIISFSDLPLRMAVGAGSFVALLGFLMTVMLVMNRVFFGGIELGYTSTVSVIILLGGVQILVMGLASLYIGRILREVQNRPLFVVREKKGL